MMSYKELLEHSYKIVVETFECAPENRLQYLGDHIFDFTTYDGDMSELFALKALEVCAAINNKLTFDYIGEPNNYRWYLLMCNTPFFAERLEWGTSIRGAWWGANRGQEIELNTCGLWIDDRQIVETLKFTRKEWEAFISALIEFGAPWLANTTEASPAAKPVG